MGGDIIAGTNMVDALRVFESDPETAGIVLVGEVGGRAEEDAADWIVDYRKRVGEKAKPIAALVGGIVAPEGRITGHAGAWRGVGEVCCTRGGGSDNGAASGRLWGRDEDAAQSEWARRRQDCG